MKSSRDIAAEMAKIVFISDKKEVAAKRRAEYFIIRLRRGELDALGNEFDKALGDHKAEFVKTVTDHYQAKNAPQDVSGLVSFHEIVSLLTKDNKKELSDDTKVLFGEKITVILLQLKTRLEQSDKKRTFDTTKIFDGTIEQYLKKLQGEHDQVQSKEIDAHNPFDAIQDPADAEAKTAAASTVDYTEVTKWLDIRTLEIASKYPTLGTKHTKDGSLAALNDKLAGEKDFAKKVALIEATLQENFTEFHGRKTTRLLNWMSTEPTLYSDKLRLNPDGYHFVRMWAQTLDSLYQQYPELKDRPATVKNGAVMSTFCRTVATHVVDPKQRKVEKKDVVIEPSKTVDYRFKEKECPRKPGAAFTR